MDPGLLLNIVLFLAVLAVCAVALRLLLPTVLAHFKGGAGGWDAFAGRYATRDQPAGEVSPRQSIIAGVVLYRFCVTVGIGKPGLYLAVGGPLPRTPILIPWSAFKGVKPARLFWKRAALVSVGDPLVGTLTLPMGLYARMLPYLPETVQMAEPTATKAI